MEARCLNSAVNLMQLAVAYGVLKPVVDAFVMS